MMGAFTYIAIDLTRRQEEQLKRYDRTTATTTAATRTQNTVPAGSPSVAPSATTTAAKQQGV
jgi:hypothetical protein